MKTIKCNYSKEEDVIRFSINLHSISSCWFYLLFQISNLKWFTYFQETYSAGKKRQSNERMWEYDISWEQISAISIFDVVNGPVILNYLKYWAWLNEQHLKFTKRFCMILFIWFAQCIFSLANILFQNLDWKMTNWPYHFNFLKAVFHKFHLVHFWIICPTCNFYLFKKFLDWSE